MLQVLNAKERNQAFIKFTAFFTLTTIMIICAVFIDFRGLPEARRKFLEQKFENQRSEMQAQQEFVIQMEKAGLLLDSLSKSSGSQAQIDILLTGKLNDMERLRPKDSAISGKLSGAILEAFLELKEMKKEKARLSDQAAKAREWEQNFNNCQAALDIYRSRPQVISGTN